MSTLFPSSSDPVPKVIVTAGQLPGYVAASQAPSKRPPWRTIRETSYVNSVTVILPDDLHQAIWDGIDVDVSKPKYAKVIMKLEDVLQGDFFTEYIKKGDILMISEGDPGVDDTFSLKEGTLRLDLSKESYERAGLQGLPIPSGGRKHVKARYLVEFNLRLPSALRGRKGFDRLVWAAQNVLNKSLSWLFVDLKTDPSVQAECPLSRHHPIVQELGCSKQELPQILIPIALSTCIANPTTLSLEETEESIHDVLEYLDMAALASPRIEGSDQVDSFLSRPVAVVALIQIADSKPDSKNSRIKNLTTCAIQQQWLAVSVSSLQTKAIRQIDGYTILLQPFHDIEQNRTDEDADDVDRKDQGEFEMDEGGNASEAGAINGTALTRAESTGESNQKPETISARTGFQRFICAEYIDTLT
ncbi:hypothetical protein H2200_008608 [Cladophialophora chaetospira]|uniref:Uncharacterized protein n=1 Tax=Cladophialophora chaetospira TaxID=386627 RepID=A0AA38X4G1_9EURO|nr:hypothetical protein H2200_008608 [Cladophialophora chaetospira]